MSGVSDRMDHVAAVALEARELARRLLVASETHSQKLTRMFSTLLASDVDVESLDKSAQDNAAIGHTFAVMFLLAGVTGMPHIKGQDAQQWMSEWKANNSGSWHAQVNKLSKDLPRAYGSDIGAPLFSKAMQLVGARSDRREQAEGLVMDVLGNFLKGAGQSLKPESISQAISYVQNSIKNTAINTMKREKRQQSLTRETDEGEVQDEIAQDHDIDDMMEDHNARLIVEEILHDSKLKGELEKVHPDAMQYLVLLSQGYDDVEILGVNAKREVIGEPKLHHPLLPSGERMYPANWNNKKHKMFDIIKNHFRHGGEHEHHASAYDYERRASV